MIDAEPLPTDFPPETADVSSPRRGRPPGSAATSSPAQIAERSRRIIDASYDILAEEGLEGLTIRAVLTRTGLSRRAFYERFAGKDDLVLAVFEHTISAAALHYRESTRAVADPLERLRLVVQSIGMARGGLNDEDVRIGSHLRSAALSREHLRLAEARPDDLQAALKPLFSLLEHMLADGMATGQVRRARPERLATLVYNLVSTTVHAQLLAEESAGPDQALREELAADIWDFCRRAIAA